jgi:class 3 adenylate cyclase
MTSREAKHVLEQLPFPVILMDNVGRTVFQNAVSRSENEGPSEEGEHVHEQHERNKEPEYVEDLEQKIQRDGDSFRMSIRTRDGRRQMILVQEPQDVRSLRSRENVAMRLLRDIFPLHIQDMLARVAEQSLPNDAGLTGLLHSDVTVAFIDIVGYTSMASQVSPRAVMTFLNTLFALLDDLTDHTGVQKIETSGDCYIVAGGLHDRTGSGAVSAARAVLAFAEMALSSTRSMMAPNGQAMRIRVGVHTGPCVSGIVGVKVPKFGLFGDTMNTASRMESTGKVGAVQASDSTYRLVQEDGREWVPTGGINIKGKGTMQTYVWTPPHEDARRIPIRRLESLQFRADLLHLLGKPRITRHASLDE